MRSSCASRPPEAVDFVLRTHSDSPLDHAKGQKALDPAKNADAFFRNEKIICKANYASCSPVSPGAVQLRRPAAGGGIPDRAHACIAVIDFSEKDA